MKNMKCLLVSLIALGAISANAQVPTGAFTYVFTNLPLWDISGSYTFSGSSNGITDTATLVISNAANGKITGTLVDTISEGFLSVHVNSTVKGKISVRAGVPVASLRSSGTLSGVATGTARGTSIETIDADALTLNADIKGTIKPHGSKPRKFSATTTAPLPVGMDGDWQLDTNIIATGNKLSGTGTLSLSNGRDLTYQITGNFNTTSEIAKLRLKGQGDALGTSISMTTQGTNMDLTVLKGKVLGQKPTVP